MDKSGGIPICAEIHGLLGFTTSDRHSKQRLGFFGKFHLVGLRGFGGIVISPEPDHFFGEFCGAVAGIVRAFAETEMKVVVLQLQGVRQANVGQRPTAVAFELQIFGAVL